MPRAKRRKKSGFADWLGKGSWKDFIDTSFNDGLFENRGFEGALDAVEGGPIGEEIAARRDAMEAQVAARNQMQRRRFDKPLPTAPYIAGYTDMANAPPEMRMAGYLEWIGKSPQERYEDSALGAMDTFSMEGPSPGRAVLGDMAFGNSYWAGLARNIANGKPLPEANLPRMDAEEGQPWTDPANTSPMGMFAERVGGQRPGGYTGFASHDPAINLRNEASRITDEKGPSYDAWARNIARSRGIDYDSMEGAALIRRIYDTLMGR